MTKYVYHVSFHYVTRVEGELINKVEDGMISVDFKVVDTDSYKALKAQLMKDKKLMPEYTALTLNSLNLMCVREVE